jgi:glycosyltransferase involved in cell wall biosynthesis
MEAPQQLNVSPPAFSVVIAAHNSADTIAEAIESVRRQTRSDWELIVVDDGSRDATAEVAEGVGDPRVRVVREPTNRGPSAARNRGLSLAQAPFVCTLDSDDLYLPQFIETMAATLEANPTASVAFTDAWVLDEATGRIRKKSAMATHEPPDPLPDDPQTFLVELLQHNFIFNSVAARRDSLLAVGGYDERLWIDEDWELWLRLAAAGFRFARAPQLLTVYRKHPNSLTSDSERLVTAKREVYRMVAEDWDASTEVRDLALELLQRNELRTRRRATAVRLLKPLFALWGKFRDSTLWHRQPPRDVAELLLTITTTRQA